MVKREAIRGAPLGGIEVLHCLDVVEQRLHGCTCHCLIIE